MKISGSGTESTHSATWTQKKILLVSPDSGRDAAARMFFSPPLGVMRLVGYLRAKGHEAEFYDPNLFACNQKGLSLTEKLREKQWDFVGFSVLDETLLQDIQNMYEAKKLCPNALIIAGGIEAQFNFQTLLDKSPTRIVVLGEGEIPVRMLADGEPWENIPGIVVKNMAVALSQELFNEATQLIPWETINYEDYWDIYVDMYKEQWSDEIADQVQTVRIFARNRCPIGCKYCSSTPQLTLATGGKVPVISTTDENLISVIDRVVASHPKVRMIYFTDDDFCINKPAVIQFCKKIIEHDFGDLIFMCFARITDLSEEVIQWMRKANFRKLNIGVESFSQRVLEEIGKRCDAERIHTTLALLKKYGVRPYFNIILTSPQSTLDDIELTIDEVTRYLSDDFYQAGIIPAMYPLKGTEFAETYWEYKSEIVDIPGTQHHIRRDEIIYAVDPMTKEFQIRFLERVDAEVDRFAQENDVYHRNSANLAITKLRLAKDLIADIREEFGVKRNSPPSENETLDYSADGSRTDVGREGDSTRHALV